MQTVARLETVVLQIAFWVALILGALALFTVSGLFRVLSYLVEQRNKEIGVRMALGASSKQVTQMMLSQTTRPVLYGLLRGAGLAATLATVVLATEAGAMIGEIVHVTDPVAYAWPDRDHRRLPARLVDSRVARVARRSDADAAPGVSQRCRARLRIAA